jgi:pimeloyl-ACP methyl ester carboxylesterase
VLRVGVLSYLGFCLMLMALQRKLIYLPTRAPEAALVRLARNESLEVWRGGAAGAPQGWRTIPAAPAPGQAAAAKAPPRMVVFHGNAGHALQRAYLADLLRGIPKGGTEAPPSWHVFLFEYPGFGARPGTPNEGDIVGQAVAAVDGLWDENPTPVFLMGESLGCAVACAVARQRPERVAGLLLMTPFNNLAAVARHHYPFLPVRWLLREHYASDENLRGYRGPVAFVLASDDEVVPPTLGRKLYEGYGGPKRLWTLAGSGHNDIAYGVDASWWRESIRFLLGGAGAAAVPRRT